MYTRSLVNPLFRSYSTASRIFVPDTLKWSSGVKGCVSVDTKEPKTRVRVELPSHLNDSGVHVALLDVHATRKEKSIPSLIQVESGSCSAIWLGDEKKSQYVIQHPHFERFGIYVTLQALASFSLCFDSDVGIDPLGFIVWAGKVQADQSKAFNLESTVREKASIATSLEKPRRSDWVGAEPVPTLDVQKSTMLEVDRRFAEMRKRKEAEQMREEDAKHAEKAKRFVPESPSFRKS